MTDDLAALRAECERLKAATPSGRWTHSRYRNENGWWSSLVLEDGERARIDSVLTLLTTPTANQEGGGDVVEIACRLRNALPQIIAAIARAEAAERRVKMLEDAYTEADPAGLHARIQELSLLVADSHTRAAEAERERDEFMNLLSHDQAAHEMIASVTEDNAALRARVEALEAGLRDQLTDCICYCDDSMAMIGRSQCKTCSGNALLAAPATGGERREVD